MIVDHSSQNSVEKKCGAKKFLDPSPVQPRFRRQREPHEVEAVAQAEAVMRGVRHDAAVAIDDVRPVAKRVARIEGEEFFFDRNRRIARRRDRLQQVERAAEFVVEDGTRQVVAGLRIAAQKEPAAHPLIRLVDRDVLAGHSRVADEIRGRRQPAKPATDDMRLHQPPPLDSGFGNRGQPCFSDFNVPPGASKLQRRVGPRAQLYH
jgi:hypothetical protein